MFDLLRISSGFLESLSYIGEFLLFAPFPELQGLSIGAMIFSSGLTVILTYKLVKFFTDLIL